MDKCLKEKEAVYLKTKSLLRILVIKLSSLGDVILALPSLKELKEQFPQAKIYFLTLKKHASFLYDCPYVDEVITVDDDYKKFRKLLDIAQNIRRKSFDYIIDFQNNRASHIISFLSLPLRSFGYSLRLGFLLNKRIPYQRSDCPLRSQERLLELLGIRFKEKKLVFWKPQGSGLKFLPDADYIGISVSASARWQSKNWPTSHLINLIEMIYKNYPSYRIVLLGDESAREKAKMLEKHLKPFSLDLCSKVSLRELPAVITKLKLLITPDTATLHLALSLGIPVVALFGPTDPLRHVVMSENLYLLYRKLPCSFCYKPKCKLKEKNLCMESISAQEVFARVKDIIQKMQVNLKTTS
jgi:ADP-heptose:LPS heptosyltransferase